MARGKRVDMSGTLAFGNPPIAVDLRHSARSRRLSLRVSRLDGKVTLTMPPRTPRRAAEAFLADREDWLRFHLAEVSPAHPVRIGGQVPVRGHALPVRGAPVRRARLTAEAIEVPEDGRATGTKVAALLKLQARDALAAASDRYAAALGRRYARITLRDTRSRWGSCSLRGTLMYSWRLIMAPPEVLDYVAAHEVAHLVEMNHSPAFWAVVTRLIPDYAERRDWLRREGSALHRIDFED